MAYIKSIWVYDPKDKEPYMSVNVAMKPHGEASVRVSLPPGFLKALLGVAQAAADAHESLARAEILGEQTNKPKTTERE